MARDEGPVATDPNSAVGTVSSHSLASPRWGKWPAWAALALFIVLVLGPVVYKQAPREISRWYHAAAVEHHLDGRLADAKDSLDKAAAWYPDDGRLLLQQAEWEREAGDYEGALRTCEQAQARSVHPLRVLLERSLIHQHLKRWADALDDWKQIAALVEEGEGTLSNASVLNGLAYARALADTELDKALQDAERAVELLGQNAALLDTRGFVHYRLKNWGAARRDLDAAIALLDSERSSGSAGASEPERASEDPREAKRQRRERDRTLAVLVYHRLLVLEQQADSVAAADADRKRIQELGFSPDDSLF